MLKTCDTDKEQCLASIPANLPEHHVGSRTLRQVALVTVTALPPFVGGTLLKEVGLWPGLHL